MAVRHAPVNCAIRIITESTRKHTQSIKRRHGPTFTFVGFVAQVGRQTRLPQPQTQLCHGTHGHRARAPELRETVEQSHTHMQLHHLPLKRARHHPLAQAFEAVHLGLHQTSAVIAAPLFPDAAPQSVTGSQRFVARMRSHQGRLPRLGVLARGDHRLRISLGNRRMARLGVVGTVPTDAGNRLIGWYLLQQLEQHGRIAHAVVGHLDGPDLQRVGINTQVHLAPLAPVLGTVLLAFPFAFAKELNAGAVHQQFQCGGTGSVGQLYLQSLLASAHGAVVGHPPVQACQTQQAFNHAQALTQGQTEQALDAQTELDGCVGEDVLAPAFAAGWGVPLHAFVQPDCQRPSGFERGVVLCPVGGLVAGLGPLRFTHVSRLPAQRTGFVQQSPAELEREAELLSDHFIRWLIYAGMFATGTERQRRWYGLCVLTRQGSANGSFV